MRIVLQVLLIGSMMPLVGCATTRHVGEVLGGKNALWGARKMEDPYFPDERREGIMFLVDHGYGQRHPYTTRYKQIAQNDPDYTVRAAAVRALNIARDKSASSVFIAALNDTSDMVRIEGAKALVNLPSRNAVELLKKIVASQVENKDLRIAATEALKHYRDIGVARTLVNVLNGRDFGVAWQARHSLVGMTGRDLHYDESAWLKYLTAPGNPLG
jgi:HEAT repeat protein